MHLNPDDAKLAIMKIASIDAVSGATHTG